MQVLQLIALHLLFAALGFCHVSRAATRDAEGVHEDLRAGEDAAVNGASAAEGPPQGILALPQQLASACMAAAALALYAAQRNACICTTFYLTSHYDC